MRLLALFITLTVTLVGCTSQTAPIAPNSTYSQIGATVRSPNQVGWTLVQARPDGVAFRAQLEDGASAVALTHVAQLAGIPGDKQFFDRAFALRAQDSDSARFTIIQATKQRTTYKGASCFKTVDIARDNKPRTSATGAQYISNTGYFCRHPSNRDVMIMMEYSLRSGAKTLSGASRSQAQAFFAGVTFTGDGL